MVDNQHENPKLIELSNLLSGKWRVTGHEIKGEAEYRVVQNGLLLVQTIDFVVSGTPMKVMQHIMYDQAASVLQADYMDTMGDRSVYVWQLDGRRLRVSHESKDADTYFEAIFNDDYPKYSGAWHYPANSGSEPDEAMITYTRIA